MIRVALRGLAGRKLRASLTAIAIVLGVAMISGTYVLTDTIDKAFTSLFTDSYANTDVVVSGELAFETEGAETPPFDDGLLDRVRELPGVDAAVGGLQSFDVQLTDKQGETIETSGAPTLGFGIDPDEERFNPLVLTAGDWARGPGQVVLDNGTAEDEGFQVGDPIGIRATGPLEQFTVVGIARFGTVDSIGSATAAYFDVATAQTLFGREGLLDGIQIAAEPGIDPDDLLARVQAILPDGVKAQSATEQAEEDAADVNEAISFIRYFLLAFGGIALFVGAFVIFNTLSITVAQRTREFATLRTVGASRRQVLLSVIVEALVIGVIASIVGLFAGLGLAKGLNAIFVAAGVDLPQTGLVFAGRTVVVSLVVGIVITLVAGLFPAVRATRVPPIAAVREGATLPRSWLGRFATPLALLVTALGVALIVLGMFASGLSTANVLALLGVGVLVLFVGIALVSAKLVPPITALVGWPASRLGGVAGRLARENAIRNPQRTAATAAALMIGLALITFVAVLARGITNSVEDAIDQQVSTDYVVVSENGFTPFQPGVDDGIAGVPGVRLSPVRGDFAQVAGTEVQLTGVAPETIASVYEFDWTAGSDAAVEALTPGQAVVESGFADDENLRRGSTITVTAPNGRTATVEVVGVYEAPAFWSMLGDVSVRADEFDGLYDTPRNLYTFVVADGGATPQTAAALETVVLDYPGVVVETQEGFKDIQSEGVNRLLLFLYVLLALSVIVSLFGMVNTLVLSVFERTRELGMLRAVGMTRRQARRMIRQESIITALIGAALGLPLGIALAALVTVKLEDEGLSFAVPVTTIVVFVAAAILAGVLAAVWPARRAARLDVLRALQYE
jgi:putative ABC transport system permease protein